jgi:small subunit ribosomal protein S16
MTVRLRLAVHGVRNNRIFHLVAIDQRKRRNAKPIELLGVYRPRVEPKSPQKSVEWSVDRIKYWLGVGAQPSDSVVKLLTTVRPVYTSSVPCACLNSNSDLGNRETLYHRIRSGIQSLPFEYNTRKTLLHHPHNPTTTTINNIITSFA